MHGGIDRGIDAQLVHRVLRSGIDLAAGEHIECEGVGRGGECGDNALRPEEVAEFGVDQALECVLDRGIAEDLDGRGPDLFADRVPECVAAEELGNQLGNALRNVRIQPRLDIRVAEQVTHQRRQRVIQSRHDALVGQQ